ncbi:secretin and TonB N-terminal domain-containing protein [Candidatus Marinimicrobia bacterium]|nr:secretin and TonB N-terminal domain-containing protein [Candidatus Neomarinimicrobiota bacterium]
MIRIKKLIKLTVLTIFISSVLFSQEDKLEDARPLVSIHAEDTHLPSILAILAEESGYNIVTGPNVQSKNKLTIHLDEVPIDQAINLVIRAAGLSYEIVGNSILVANQSKINEDVGVSPAVIPLQYANAEEVAILLKDITEKISIDATGNKLLVTASPKKIAEVQTIVSEIDVPSIQIMLEARLIEVALNETEELGIDWERLASTTLILAETGEPQNITESLVTGSYLPGYVPEVVAGADGSDAFVFEQITGTATGALPDQMAFTRSGGVNSFGRQLTAFDVTLDMLLKDNKANILTNSQIVTVNGHEAEIQMVDVIPYLASNGGFGNSNFQVLKETVGIKLKILPYVNTDGYITTQITPEVSSIQSWTAQGYPWTKKRESTTTVRVKDGQTIVIAGLITTESINTDTKVPVLWRIPWFGKKWFTHTEMQDKKTDLIIQVTPSIVKDNYSGIDKQDYHKNAEEKAFEEEN